MNIPAERTNKSAVREDVRAFSKEIVEGKHVQRCAKAEVDQIGGMIEGIFFLRDIVVHGDHCEVRNDGQTRKQAI